MTDNKERARQFVENLTHYPSPQRPTDPTYRRPYFWDDVAKVQALMDAADIKEA